MIALIGDDHIKTFISDAPAISNPIVRNAKQAVKNNQWLIAQAAIAPEKKFHIERMKSKFTKKVSGFLFELFQMVKLFHLEEAADTTQMFFYPFIAKLIHFIRQTIKEIAVVRNKDQGAIVIL